MKIHVMGIGGSGASACAAIAAKSGFEVTGCDQDPNSPYLTQLSKIKVEDGHSPLHLEGVEQLILSPAIESLHHDNPEVLEARKLGIPVLTWQEFTGTFLMKDKKVIAVTGTHGKTTTTTMIALVLEKAGLDPTVIVGATVPLWKRNYRCGKGNIFVIEADEFGDNFLNYSADLAVITNIEMDHPEYFKDFAQLQKSFQTFVKKMKPNSKLFTLEKSNLTSQQVETVAVTAQKFDLAVLGEYNQINATFCYLICRELGIDSELIKETLRNFTGAGRRLELVGESQGMKVYDDYGHHPTEITATSEALRERYPRAQIWLIYQPHMYTRTKYLFNDFVKSLRNAPVDQVIITEIWQSREPNDYSVNSQQLVDAIAKSSVRKMVKYTDIASYIMTHKNADSIALFMGAGDIYLASRELLKRLNG